MVVRWGWGWSGGGGEMTPFPPPPPATWGGGGVSVQQVVILGGVEVHGSTGAVQQLLVAAGAGDAVVAAVARPAVARPAVARAAVQLLRLHLATQGPATRTAHHRRG